MAQETITLDAAGKSLGRVASEAASFLRGKHRPDFAPQRFLGVLVLIVNAGKIKREGRKNVTMTFRRHTMHPGGFRIEPFAKRFSQNPAWVMRHAVAGMLPKNKLRKRFLRNLSVSV